MKHQSNLKVLPVSKDPENFSGKTNPTFQDLHVGLLLDPRIPARLAFDDVKFSELCDSIRTWGRVLLPLLVEREGDKYRVHAGHRRTEAARVVGLETVPCMVYDAGTIAGEAAKSHENAFREDLNVAEEAEYFVKLLEGVCENDVHKLCLMVKQKEPYVQQRLALKLGDPRIFDALSMGLISIGVAQELNLVKSPGYRLQYVTVAAQGGCSVRQARDWRVAANNMPEQDGSVAEIITAQAPPPPPPPNSDPTCMFCNRNDDQFEIAVLFAHRSCLKAAERRAEGGAA